jgi:pSer/pThr/pTyr-binding forkhead associated (FHA) protein
MKFEIMVGPEDGKILEFAEEKIRIGRRLVGNDLVLFHDPRASKEHAETINKGKIFTVVDKNSTHGTTMRKKCHLHPKEGMDREAELSPGDILIMGKTWVRFLG